MLNSRLLIVGLFATVCAWLPGILAAQELVRDYDLMLSLQRQRDMISARPRPERYTLDTFSSPPYRGLKPDVDTQHQFDTREPVTFNFYFAGASSGKTNWDPVALDDFGGRRAVTARYQAAAPAENDSAVMPCGHSCPVCQNSLPPATDAAAEYVPEEPAEMKLREGEAAKVLLQTMKQVRPSIIDGTIFQESRPIDGAEAMPLEGEGTAAIIVHCIRNLEAQAERHRLPEGTACMSSSSAPPAPTCPSSLAGPETTPEAVTALRQAGRELEATANMLEERGLYDQADHLRAVAQEMRIEARAATTASQPTVSYAPMPMPGPGGDGDELAGDEDPDRREPKLRYDGDCNDKD